MEREDLGRGSWVLTPNDQGAVGFAWIDWSDALHLEVPDPSTLAPFGAQTPKNTSPDAGHE